MGTGGVKAGEVFDFLLTTKDEDVLVWECGQRGRFIPFLGCADSV
jgi:hypothetical protein